MRGSRRWSRRTSSTRSSNREMNPPRKGSRPNARALGDAIRTELVLGSKQSWYRRSAVMICEGLSSTARSPFQAGPVHFPACTSYGADRPHHVCESSQHLHIDRVIKSADLLSAAEPGATHLFCLVFWYGPIWGGWARQSLLMGAETPQSLTDAYPPCRGGHRLVPLADRIRGSLSGR